MKRILTGLLILCGASVLFAQEAIIRDISGTVEVKAPNAAEWQPAVQGQSIARKAVVSTGFKSTAVLAVGNSIISVQPLTRLTVEEIQESAGEERVNLNLQTGRIRADVKPPAGGRTEFTVKSPSATASVRGTSFEFDGINLQVDEGRVHFTGGNLIGTYVGVGHIARTDIDTGHTTGAAEITREELTPAIPAGIDSVPETPAITTSVITPVTGDINAGFDWQ